MIKLNRREIIKASAWFASGAVVGVGLDNVVSTLVQANEPLSDYIRDLQGMQKLGIYLSNEVNSYHSQTGLQQLTSKLVKFNRLSSTDEVKDAISKSVKNDYLTKTFCELKDGWILSETECLLAISYQQIVPDQELLRDSNSDSSDFHTAVEKKFIEIENWGPQSTISGRKFNVQRDGHCGLWFKAESASPNLQISVDGKIRLTNINVPTGVITSGIHENIEEFINTIGKKEIYIYDDIKNIKQYIGDFVVEPQPQMHVYDDGTRSKVFCSISQWGPKKTKTGAAFNQQPNGDSAFWFKTECTSPSSVIYFENIPLPTVTRQKTITARMKLSIIPTLPRKYLISLKDSRFPDSSTNCLKFSLLLILEGIWPRSNIRIAQIMPAIFGLDGQIGLSFIFEHIPPLAGFFSKPCTPRCF